MAGTDTGATESLLPLDQVSTPQLQALARSSDSWIALDASLEGRDSVDLTGSVRASSQGWLALVFLALMLFSLSGPISESVGNSSAGDLSVSAVVTLGLTVLSAGASRSSR